MHLERANLSASITWQELERKKLNWNGARNTLNMAKIYFICGFIGSGKTTYAKQLANTHAAFRFSIDEWMIPLFGEHMPRELFDERIDILTELFKSSAIQMMQLNTSVIFDFGFWNQLERTKITQWAQSQGFDFELIYLDSSFEICGQRAYKRNADRLDKAYEMTPEMLQMFWQLFEVPTPHEKVTYVKSSNN